MREIKFQYIWKCGDSIAKARCTIEDIEKGCAKAPRSRDGSRMKDWDLVARRQYTGFKDRNGVEIYEGDILKIFFHKEFHDEYISVEEGYECFVKVHWSLAGCWSFNESDMIGYSPLSIEDFSSIEVIGNIHQNPELGDA